MRIGSLFSGAGMLDLAALQLFPGSAMAWHCEFADAPAKVLAHHWPDVPNYRDVTEIDWATMPPIDVLTGGYPCQPFSPAGKRKGTDDERHLWPYVRQAICDLRPRFTLLENVAGHRSLGFDRVLGDLAEDGLYAQWASLRASDVGACHRRERLFILVTNPDDAARDGEWARSESGQRDPHPADAASDGRTWLHDGTGGAAARGGRQRKLAGSTRGASVPVAGSFLPTPRATDGTKGGPNQHGSSGDLMLPSAVMTMLPTPSVADGTGGHASRSGDRSEELLLPGVAKAYAEGRLLPTPNAADGNGGGRFNAEGHQSTLPGSVRTLPDTQWGEYEPAIRRQEALTRPAPSPTEPNSKGKPRLSAEFASWMMMLPENWVTDPAIGLSRNDQLKIIGNGVVTPCAIAAFRYLLEIGEVAA